MKYRLRIQLDHLPTSLNKTLRSHYFKKSREMNAWAILIGSEVSGKKPKAPLSKASISITRHSYRSLDFDGLVGSLKPVVDALVTVGILKDDSWNVLGAWKVDQAFRPKAKGPLLEIYLEEIPDRGLN